MRKFIINSIIGVALTASMASCGDSWLETKYYSGVESEGALTSPTVIYYALNGTYYQLQYYYFAGNYATNIGDVASDITYSGGSTGHFSNIYGFNYTDTDSYLDYIWYQGYKVIDNSARIIEACEALLPNASDYDAVDLMQLEAEALGLRAYASLQLVNVFAHQAMVAGTSYLDLPGIVIVEKPVVAFSHVERSTIGETYDFILNDLQTSIDLFKAIGNDYVDVNYMNLAAVYGLQARAYMYLENWQLAATAAKNALNVAGITELTYTDQGYMSLYEGGNSNDESFFTLGLNSQTSWSANSCGTLYTSYGFSSSPYLFSLYGDDDCRLSIQYFNLSDEQPDPFSANWCGGKFGYFGGSNPSYATNYLINAPEMFLIEAEAYANLNQISNAQEALLVVAKRNPDITQASQVGATSSEILTFLHDERARELFQEGFRLFDLRRWNIPCNLNATGAPAIQWNITNVQLGNLVFPIPADEINAGFGVTQNEGWAGTRPK